VNLLITAHNASEISIANHRSDLGPSGRSFLAMALDPSPMRIILFGGYSQAMRMLGETWTWDNVEWSEAFPPGRQPPSRYGASMALDRDRARTVLFGGVQYTNGAAVSLDDIWEWTGSQWIDRTAPARRPLYVVSQNMAYDRHRRRMVYVGEETWEWITDPTDRPAMIFTADFGYGYVATSSVGAIEVNGFAGGAGGTPAEAGAELAFWDASPM
jgi:hypothetical protein